MTVRAWVPVLARSPPGPDRTASISVAKQAGGLSWIAGLLGLTERRRVGSWLGEFPKVRSWIEAEHFLLLDKQAEEKDSCES